MSDFYILDPDRKVIQATLFEWGVFFEDLDNRRVAQTEIRKGVYVSTVFLGLDHRFAGEGPPLVFETMAFRARREWRPGKSEKEIREMETALGGPVPELLAEGRYTLGDEIDMERTSTWDDAVMAHELMVERYGTIGSPPEDTEPAGG